MPERRPRLEGKVAIVTGAGSKAPGEYGTGKAISVVFAREGAKVLVMDQVASRAQETVAIIKKEGGEAAVFAGDITKAKDCEAAASAAVQRFGGLHILVNNVGISRTEDVVSVTEEDWDLVLDVNLKGMVLMAKYAVPKMIEAGGGAIINMSSVSGLLPSGGGVAYTASKGGVQAMTRFIAVQHGRQGIRANCIAPGNLYNPTFNWKLTSQNKTEEASRMTEESRRQRRVANPLGLEGTAWDIAYAALFFASDEARWVSGQTMAVDGGYTSAAIAWFTRTQREEAAGKPGR